MGSPSYACHFMDRINSRGIWFGDNPLAYSVPSLLLQTSIITIITRSFHLILKPFGQPMIVSQILAGVVLGPSVLGQNAGFLSKLFPSEGRVVLDTFSAFGFMLFIFLIGVKVDPTMVMRTGKKALAIGIMGFFIPYGLASLVAFLLNQFASQDNEISEVLPYVVAVQSITAFPVITCFLKELNILNSEIGRLASSSSIICDVCNWVVMSVNYAIKLAALRSFKMTVGSFMSGALFLAFIVFGIRPAALWAIRHTPEGKSVKESYIFAVVAALIVCGFIGEVIGVSAIVASLAFGLVIPDGPPLGTALVERLDCFVSVLLMPQFFMKCGLRTNFFSITKLENVGALQLLVLVSFVGKLVGTILPPLFCRMPFRDALSLALIMNTKGIIELALLARMKQSRLLSAESYAIMVISVVVITGVISPIVKVLYDPSRKYIAYKRRTILHSRCNEELRVLTCLHCSENVQAVISLLQASNPTKESPINLVVLHLVKLMGRATSLLIAHRQREKPSPNPSQSERIFSAFRKFEQLNQGRLTVQNSYKGISPYATMHNDVCSLALDKRTILIIIPFHKQWIFGETVQTSYAFRHLNRNVLEKAPCSVGVLLDRLKQKNSRFVMSEQLLKKVAVLFFGGADDREALAYGKRMAENPSVKLCLVRFITSNSSDIVGGKPRSKILDADILSDYRLNTMRSERVLYQEEVVSSGMDVVAVTRSIGNDYDLVMVGRRHGESRIMFQLNKWNERGDLGAVGEILAASDFEGWASVLVMQQQTRLWGLHDPEESTHLRKISS